MKKINCLFVFLMCFLAFGCSTRMLDFTIISSKNFDISSVSDYQKGTERVNGEDTLFFLLGIPLGSSINVKEAVDKAIEGVPGCVALADGVIYSKWWSIGFIGQTGFLVEGTPVIDKSLISSLKSKYIYAQYDVKTKLFDYKYLTKNEFCNLKNKLIENK